jgi:hypothetical protein
MAFWDTDPVDPCAAKTNGLKAAVNSSNAFTGIVVPTQGWQLELLKMPFSTSLEDIQTIFTKYGAIDKVALVFSKSSQKS